MIRFERAAEPPDFDEKVRAPGRRWLASHRRRKEPLEPYWREAYPELRRAFHDLCAYSAQFTERGTVDHFVPTSRDRRAAYEWTNLRHASFWINASKQALEPHQLLDPFEIRNEWFEMLLPSCQVVVTDACPPELRERAEAMLIRLHLRNGAEVVRPRRKWLEMYEKGRLTLAGLEEMAPMIARAVRKREALGKPVRLRRATRSKPKAPPKRRAPPRPGRRRPRR